MTRFRGAVSKAAQNNVEWLTIPEVAEYLQTGVDMIYDACAIGGLKHARLGHRTIRVRRAWVDEWVETKAKQFP
jgi:excisionase family DNA binding protein